MVEEGLLNGGAVQELRMQPLDSVVSKFKY